MSIISSIESLISGFSLTAVKEIAVKSAHSILDDVAAKADGEAGDLLSAEAAKLGLTITREQASALVKVVIDNVRAHI